MSSDKFEILLQKLKMRTQASEISWEKTSTDNEFQTVLGKYVIRLTQLYNSDSYSPEPDYFLSIFDEEGSMVDSISDVQINQANPDFKSFQIMSDIFSLARRSAMGVDKALDSIIRELDNIPPF